MSRKLRQAASALLVATSLLATASPPARALSRSARPGGDGPSRPAERVEHGFFFSVLLRLVELARGTMDPNGGP